MSDYGAKAPALEASGERERLDARARSSPQRSGAPREEELRELFARFKGNVAGIARELGKDRVQIHRWMRRFGIAADDFRDR
jgi:transcriptional regulator of acetoin/glycerol metabolism